MSANNDLMMLGDKSRELEAGALPTVGDLPPVEAPAGANLGGVSAMPGTPQGVTLDDSWIDDGDVPSEVQPEAPATQESLAADATMSTPHSPEIVELAKKAGMTPYDVMTNFDAAKFAAEKNDRTNALMTADSPALVEMLNRNPETAALVGDKVKGLSEAATQMKVLRDIEDDENALGRYWEAEMRGDPDGGANAKPSDGQINVHNAIRAGELQFERGNLLDKIASGDLKESDPKVSSKLKELDDEIRELSFGRTDSVEFQLWNTISVMTAGATSEAGAQGGAFGALLAAAALLAAPVTGAGAAGAVAMAGVRLAVQRALTGMMAGGMFSMYRGESYESAMEKGASHEEAAQKSVFSGALQSGIDVGSDLLGLSTLKLGKLFFGRGVSNLVAKETYGSLLRAATGRYLVASGVEDAAEGAQDVVNELFADIAANQEFDFSRYARTFWTSAKEAAPVSFLLVGLGSIHGLGVDITQYHKSLAAADRLRGIVEAVNKKPVAEVSSAGTKVEGKTEAKAQTAAENEKLSEQDNVDEKKPVYEEPVQSEKSEEKTGTAVDEDPRRNGVIKEAVGAIAGESGCPSVYIDGATLMQKISDAGLTKADVEHLSPGLYEQAETAKANGGAVAIKMEDFVSDISQTKFGQTLYDDVRVRPDELSVNESRAAAYERSKAFLDVLNQLKSGEDPSFNTPAEKQTDEWKAERDAFRADLEEKLKAGLGNGKPQGVDPVVSAKFATAIISNLGELYDIPFKSMAALAPKIVLPSGDGKPARFEQQLSTALPSKAAVESGLFPDPAFERIWADFETMSKNGEAFFDQVEKIISIPGLGHFLTSGERAWLKKREAVKSDERYSAAVAKRREIEEYTRQRKAEIREAKSTARNNAQKKLDKANKEFDNVRVARREVERSKSALVTVQRHIDDYVQVGRDRLVKAAELAAERAQKGVDEAKAKIETTKERIASWERKVAEEPTSAAKSSLTKARKALPKAVDAVPVAEKAAQEARDNIEAVRESSKTANVELTGALKKEWSEATERVRAAEEALSKIDTKEIEAKEAAIRSAEAELEEAKRVPEILPDRPEGTSDARYSSMVYAENYGKADSAPKFTDEEIAALEKREDLDKSYPFRSALSAEEKADKSEKAIRDIEVQRRWKELANLAIDQMSDNLVWLHNTMSKDIRDRAKQWYDGANRTARVWATRYGLRLRQTAAVIAIYSPQNGWFNNMTNAERTLDLYFGARKERIKGAAIDKYLEAEIKNLKKAAKSQGREVTPEEIQALYDAAEKIKSSTLEELLQGVDPRDIAALRPAAYWLRWKDAEINSTDLNVETPEGGVGGKWLTSKGEPRKAFFMSVKTNQKALSVILDGSVENISAQIGDQFKVRDFYNNIYDPHNRFAATIDTHAVAADTMLPMSSASAPVAQNFSSTGGGASGQNGTYPIHFEAYRRAAERVGVSPREMQSIAWEAIRALFPPEEKSANRGAIEGFWKRVDYTDAELDEINENLAAAEKITRLTPEEAREKVLDLMGVDGKIRKTAWEDVPYTTEVTETYDRSRVKLYDDIKPPADEGMVFARVAPNPEDAKLMAAWDALDRQSQLEITEDVVPFAMSEVAKRLKIRIGEPRVNIGADKSFSISAEIENPDDVVPVARALARYLHQESVLCVHGLHGKGLAQTKTAYVDLPAIDDSAASELYKAAAGKITDEKDRGYDGMVYRDGRMQVVNADPKVLEVLQDKIGEMFPGRDIVITKQDAFSAAAEPETAEENGNDGVRTGRGHPGESEEVSGADGQAVAGGYAIDDIRHKIDRRLAEAVGRAAKRREAERKAAESAESRAEAVKEKQADERLDEEYFSAIEAGDAEKLAKLVQDRAAAAGFTDMIPEQCDTYKLRTKKSPQKTVKCYKVFTMSHKGELSALFVGGANRLPMNVWLDCVDGFNFTASNGRRYVPVFKSPDTGDKGGGTDIPIPDDPAVKQMLLDRGYISSLSTKTVKAVAYRPGWHSGELPLFPQSGKAVPEAQQIDHKYPNYHAPRQVVCEIEVGADEDYTAKAQAQDKARGANGQLIPREADLQTIPENGFYYYTTNPINQGKEADTGRWLISNSIKIKRVLTESEVNAILDERGVPHQAWADVSKARDPETHKWKTTVAKGELDLEKIGYTGRDETGARKTIAPITYDEDGHVIPLSKRFDKTNPSVLYQSEIATPDDPLVTIHRLYEYDLKQIFKSGEGMIMPSLGITKLKKQYSGFGDVALIGTRGMIDPESGVPVYDRDAYTSRYPSNSIVETDDGDKMLRHGNGELSPLTTESILGSMLDAQHPGLDDRLAEIPDDLDLQQKIGGGADTGMMLITAGARRMQSVSDIQESRDRLSFRSEARETEMPIKKAWKSVRKTLAKYDSRGYDVEERMFDAVSSMMRDETAVRVDGVFSYAAATRHLESYGFRPANAKKGFPPSLIDQLKTIVDGSFSMKTDYFEAKPHRVVGIHEFVAAVVPDSTNPGVIRDLEDLGLRVVRYDSSIESTDPDEAEYLLEGAVADVAADLHERRGDVLFQGEAPVTRGGYTPADNTLALTPNADQSTFCHEWGHWYLETIMSLQSESASLANDQKAILDWFGVKGLSAWNGMTLEDKREYHERFAYSFEKYLSEGVAPSSGLKAVFKRLSDLIISAYAGHGWSKPGEGIDKTFRQAIGKDLPPLSPEVRAIFDRMFVADTLVQTKLQGEGLKGIFATKPDGMSDEDWETIKEAETDADEAARRTIMRAQEKDEAWYVRARNAVMKTLDSQAKTIRKKTEEEVRVMVNSEPGSVALDVISSGGRAMGLDNLRLDRETVKSMVSKKQYAELERLHCLRENGCTPDVAASYLEPYTGRKIKDGKKLITEMLRALDKEDRIKTETEKRLMEEHSELFDPQRRDELVTKAVYTDARARVLATEIKALSQDPLPARVLAAAAKAAAAEKIRQTQILSVKPARFVAEAKRSAIQSQKALAAGDREALLAAKRRQLMFFECARAAKDVEHDVAAFKKLKKQVFGNTEKLVRTRDIGYVTAARYAMTMLGLGKDVTLEDGSRATRKEAAELLTKSLKDYAPEKLESLTALMDVFSSVKAEFSAMDAEDATRYMSMITGLWAQARNEKMIDLGETRIDAEKVKVELITELDSRKLPKYRPGATRTITDKEKAVSNLMSLRATLMRAENFCIFLDGGQPGTWHKYIYQPIANAAAKYRLENAELQRALVEIVEPVLDEWNSVRDIEAPELDYTFSSKTELMGAIMHTGNLSNKEKLLLGGRGEGHAWADVTIDQAGNEHVDTHKWDAFVNRMYSEGVITKSDMDAIQRVWDLTESTKSLAQKAFLALYGYTFKEVSVSPIVAPFGTYRGGYVPAKTDPRLVAEASTQEEISRLSEQDFLSMMPVREPGFTKSRVTRYTKPLSLDIAMVARHLSQVAQFGYLAPVTQSVAKILTSHEIKDRLDSYDPNVVKQLFVPWLKRAYTQQVGDGKSGWVSQTLNRLRGVAGMGIMAGHIINGLQQFTGFSIALKYVSAGSLARAAKVLASPADTYQMICDASPFMKSRLSDFAYEYQSRIARIGADEERSIRRSAGIGKLAALDRKLTPARDWINRHAYFVQTAVQAPIDMITWTAAYNEWLEQGHSHSEAVNRADSVIRTTMSDFSPEAVASVETGDALKRSLLVFYNYFGMQLNLLGESLETAKLTKKYGTFWRDALVVAYIPAVLSAMIMQAAQPSDDDDEADVLDLFRMFVGEPVRNVLAMIPFGGAMVDYAGKEAAKAGFTPAQLVWEAGAYQGRIMTSPAFDMMMGASKGLVQAAYTLPFSDSDVNARTATRNILDLLSVVTRIPFGALKRPLGYAAGVASGDISPDEPIKGVLTGKGNK